MTPVTLRAIDGRTASPSEYAALNQFRNRMLLERDPDDPPMPLTEEMGYWRNQPAFRETSLVALWRDAETLAALGRVIIYRTDENQHLANVIVEVLPELRQQGLARQLLPHLLEILQREQRRLIIGWTSARVPAGEGFMQRLGARPSFLERHSQLKLSELERERMQQWIARAPERAAGFALEFYDDDYPVDMLAPIAELQHVMNDAPRGELELEDERVTPQILEARMRSWLQRGMHVWTALARETASGQLAGFTEIFWHPNRPHIVQQGGTGVHHRYRSRGLGRWLKAAMLERVLRERPQARLVRTDNADTNAAMLNINYQLGFKPYDVQTAWQLETDKLAAYLGAA